MKLFSHQLSWHRICNRASLLKKKVAGRSVLWLSWFFAGYRFMSLRVESNTLEQNHDREQQQTETVKHFLIFTKFSVRQWRGCLQQFSALGWAPCNNSNHINMRMPEPIPTTGYLRRTNTSWQHSPCWTVENDVRESWCFKIRWHTGKKWPPNGLYSNSKFSCLANLYVTAIVKIQDTNMWLNKIPILTGVLQ